MSRRGDRECDDGGDQEARMFRHDCLRDAVLELDHLISLAVDGDSLEKNILASVPGRRAREAVGAANLQVILDAHAHPPKPVGAHPFKFPRRNLSVLTFDIDMPDGVRIDLLEFSQDARQDEFLSYVEL